jgi:hypothetical protein
MNFKYYIFLNSVLILLLFTAISCNRKTTEKETVASEKTIQKKDSDSIKTSNNSVSLNNSNDKEIGKSGSKDYSTLSDFKIISATSQKWTGGIKGAGSGINYRFTLIVSLSSQELTLDKLWIGSVFHKPRVSKKVFTENLNFQPKDTLFIYASDYFKSPDNPKFEDDGQKNEQEKPVVNIFPPYKYDGEALIGYTVNGKQKYKTIGKITILSPENRP